MSVFHLSKSDHWKREAQRIVDKSRDGDTVICEDDDVANWVRRVLVDIRPGRKMKVLIKAPELKPGDAAENAFVVDAKLLTRGEKQPILSPEQKRVFVESLKMAYGHNPDLPEPAPEPPAPDPAVPADPEAS